MLSIYDISVYENRVVPTIVPEIVPASRQKQAWNGAALPTGVADPNAAVLFADRHAGK
jgi:hypothetical protein